MVSSNLPVKSPRTLLGMMITVALFVFCLIVPKQLPSILHRPIDASTVFLISRFSFWVALTMVYLYALKVERQKLLLWQEEPYAFLYYLRNTLLTLLVVFVGTSTIQLALHFSGFATNSSKLKFMLQLSIPVKLLTIITAAFVEEIIFRGYLQSRIQLYFKHPYWPVIISALIFGLAHVTYGTLSNVLGPLFIGLVFAWHYHKYRNIKILIACHFIIDFIGLVLQR